MVTEKTTGIEKTRMVKTRMIRTIKTRMRKTGIMKVLLLSAYLVAIFTLPVFAATNTGAITKGFGALYDIIAAIISSIGQVFLLWGVFEWAISLNSNDGVMQASAFKRIAAGIVACLAPQIIPLIQSAL